MIAVRTRIGAPSRRPAIEAIGIDDLRQAEALLAAWMGAKTTEIKGASHVPFLSHPKAVAIVIEAAAK